MMPARSEFSREVAYTTAIYLRPGSNWPYLPLSRASHRPHAAWPQVPPGPPRQCLHLHPHLGVEAEVSRLRFYAPTPSREGPQATELSGLDAWRGTTVAAFAIASLRAVRGPRGTARPCPVHILFSDVGVRSQSDWQKATHAPASRLSNVDLRGGPITCTSSWKRTCPALCSAESASLRRDDSSGSSSSTEKRTSSDARSSSEWSSSGCRAEPSRSLSRCLLLPSITSKGHKRVQLVGTRSRSDSLRPRRRWVRGDRTRMSLLRSISQYLHYIRGPMQRVPERKCDQERYKNWLFGRTFLQGARQSVQPRKA